MDVSIALAIGVLLIPVLGAILLIVGVIQRIGSRKLPPPYPPGYPPPGYPGYPGHPGFPPHPPAAWPPPARRPRGTGLIVAGAVILGLTLVVGAVAMVDSSSDDTDLTVGRCVTAENYRGVAFEPPASTDCDDPDAVVELVSRGDGNATCPDGRRPGDTDYLTLFFEDVTLCFAPHFVEGSCYVVNAEEVADSPYVRVDCDAPGSRLRIVQRSDSATESTQCASGTPVLYTEIKRLYCISGA